MIMTRTSACVFFTLNHRFYPSTPGNIHPASVLIFHPKEIRQVLWSQTARQRQYIVHDHACNQHGGTIFVLTWAIPQRFSRLTLHRSHMTLTRALELSYDCKRDVHSFPKPLLVMYEIVFHGEYAPLLFYRHPR